MAVGANFNPGLIVFLLAVNINAIAQTESRIIPAPMVIHSLPDNRPLDEQMLRYLAKYTSPLVIRGVKNTLQPIKWNNPKGYWDSTLFARIEHFNPGVITAFYTLLEVRVTDNDTAFDWETMHGMDSLGVPALIPDPNDSSVFMVTRGLLYGDSRNRDFRNWILGRVDTTFHQKIITDGWQFDRAWIDPVTKFFPRPYNTDTSLIQSYMDSNYTLMEQMRLKFPEAYIQVNGISPQTYSKETKFLDFADAQNVEAFGITEQGDSIFSSAVFPYIKMMDSSAFTAKRFNIFGTAHGSYKNTGKYRFYDEEKKWERYLFGCFLLGKNRLSGFHFRRGSVYPINDTGRFGGLDLHTDYLYNRLGDPVNHYVEESNGLYSRKFKNGFVVVAPVTNPVVIYNYTLSSTCYDNEGNSYSDNISLSSGEAYILHYNKQLNLPCTYEINFEDKISSGNYIARGVQDLPNAVIKRNQNNSYLSFTALSKASGYEAFEHDIMLDWVRYQNKDSAFSFMYKTKSVTADIQLFCEVDDTLTHQYYNTILNFSVVAPVVKLFDLNYAYRTLIHPLNQPKLVPNVQSSTALINDGNWHTINIDGTELLNAGVKFIRPHFMRVKGKIDLDDIIVYHGRCFTPYFYVRR